jgi:D-arabinose 1-dehydrogenase-like Zn-dependent alcohol dehydrogenase
LVCLAPSTPPRFAVRETALPVAGRGQVLVRVEATSVNPIDVKRAGGYGQRLLALKGAGHFPLVLGNDLAGCVEAVGPDVTALTPGQRVFGLVGTGRGGGAHASHRVVPQALLRPAPADAEAAALAVLPYSFTTMWRAVRSVGLDQAVAGGRKVLVHGAAGALGRLALQLLSGWGCELTAICSATDVPTCRALGARVVVERGPQAIGTLPAHFDAVLNFASWDDEPALASRLAAQALGQATTVHPLLGHLDRLGWLRGALACGRDWRRMGAAVRQRSAGARYRWTVFAPDPEALRVLACGLPEQRFSLPVGLSVDIGSARLAFDHVAAGAPGRAVLLP